MESNQLTKITWILPQSILYGNIGMSECPGKKLQKSRNGRPIKRNIQKDLKNWKQIHKVDKIFCLLNDFQIRTLGLNDKIYKKTCQQIKIQFIQYPIIQMSIPQETQKITLILRDLTKNIKIGQRVVIHCRGGIGRTGIMACAILGLLNLETQFSKAIAFVRKVRDKRCVQSKKQQDWIQKFYKNEIMKQKADN